MPLKRTTSLIPFVKASEVKTGDTLIADGDFTCIENNAEKLVYKDSAGLYVKCNNGNHYLEGQLGGPFGGFRSQNHFVGFWKKGTSQ